MKKNVNKTLMALLLLCLCGFASCVDENKNLYNKELQNDNPLGDISAPYGFDWATVATIQATVIVNDEFNGQYNYLVEIYAQNPLIFPDANVLARGVAKKGNPFSTEIAVNKSAEYIYFMQTSPTGIKAVKGVPVAQEVTCNFGSATASTKALNASSRAATDDANVPEIPADATEVTGSEHKDLLLPNKNYKITGNYSDIICYYGSGPCKLFVSGIWTLPAAFQIEARLEIVIMPGGKIISDYGLAFVNGAALSIMPGGEFQCNELDITNASKLTNNGTANVKSLIITDRAQIINNCALRIENHLSCNAGSGYFNMNKGAVIAKTMEFTNTIMDLNNGSALIATEQIKFASGNYINNSGTATSLVKSPLMIHGWNGDIYTGSIALEADKHQRADNGIFDQYNSPYNYFRGATEYTYNGSEVEIITTCGDVINKPDSGEPENPIIDPVVDNNTYTYVFEDLWPLYGDYDMNDIVMKISNVTLSINNENKVTKYNFDASLQAVGASKTIAVAAMLDNVQATNVSSVTYSDYTPMTFDVATTGVENGQTNAVIPLVDDAHLFMKKPNRGFINTEIGSVNNVPNPVSFTVTVEFNTPVEQGALNIRKLNLFIIADINLAGVQSNMRKEIHLVNYAPTLKANREYFGNNNDDSDPNGQRYYISKENLAWGIMLEQDFLWPKEYANIRNAYKEFEAWITSGGTINQNWWENPVESLIFRW